MRNNISLISFYFVLLLFFKVFAFANNQTLDNSNAVNKEEITEASVDIDKLSKLIVYPGLAQMSGMEGTVWVNAFVGKDGKLIKSEVEKSSNKLFEQAALFAVNNADCWEPAKDSEGNPIKSMIIVPIEFRLYPDEQKQQNAEINRFNRNGETYFYTIKDNAVYFNSHNYNPTDQKDLMFSKNDYLLIEKDPIYYEYFEEPTSFFISDNLKGSGTFFVDLLIGRNSKPLMAKIDSSDMPQLNEKVLKNILHLTTWEVAESDGEKVASWVRVPIVYDFENEVQSVIVDSQELSSYISYPEIARRVGIEGTVFCNVLIDKNGKLIRSAVDKSDNEILNQSALYALNNADCWTSAKDKNGNPIKSWTSIPIEFRLSPEFGNTEFAYSDKILNGDNEYNYTIKSNTMFVNSQSYDATDQEDLKLGLDEFVFVEQEAKYNYEDIIASIDYPMIVSDGLASGTIYVNVLIGRNSKPLKAEIQYSEIPQLNREALKNILFCSNWEAAESEGKKVASWITVPIVYEVLEKLKEVSFYDKDKNKKDPFLHKNLEKLSKQLDFKVFSSMSITKIGVVQLEILIDENGRTLYVNVGNSLGNPYIEKVIERIWQHRFFPYILSDGRRAKALLKMPIYFNYN